MGFQENGFHKEKLKKKIVLKKNSGSKMEFQKNGF